MKPLLSVRNLHLVGSGTVCIDVIISLVADVGQEEDFEAARQKALKVGAKKFVLAVSLSECTVCIF
jgi:hypothetical protein